MPIITVDGPAIAELERKRAFVSKLTEVASEAYGLEREKIIVLLRENAPENVAVGGRLIADLHRGE